MLKQVNHTGTNTHHKFHGMNYEKTPSARTIGQKITTYSTQSWTTYSWSSDQICKCTNQKHLKSPN